MMPPSPPSLAPPMKRPLTNILGSNASPQISVSLILISSRSVRSKKSAERLYFFKAASASSVKGLPGREKMTTPLLFNVSSMTSPGDRVGCVAVQLTATPAFWWAEPAPSSAPAPAPSWAEPAPSSGASVPHTSPPCTNWILCSAHFSLPGSPACSRSNFPLARRCRIPPPPPILAPPRKRPLTNILGSNSSPQVSLSLSLTSSSPVRSKMNGV
mmetsp:Transcript_122784/g.342110  ORF Transcript_122784/g.342110 Transcript_122784/m.342110 type:complete len:214 (+) Transcript_122784:336-977(+)